MRQVILDTNFILTCMKQKIDFFEEIPLMGMRIIIPKQVISEIKRINNQNSGLALKLLGKNKFRQIDLGKGHVDKKLIKLAKENQGAIIATLDREIKSKVKNNKLVIRGKKRLEVI